MSVFQSTSSHTIRSASGLLARFREFAGADYLRGVYLRGQSNAEWGLQPSIARKDTYSYCGKTVPQFDLDQEKNLLHRFRRHTYAHHGRIPGKWETLFLARHHGLPVRLLDWTANPLVAMYWACVFERTPKTDAAVFVLRRKVDENRYIDTLDGDVDPEDVKGVRILYPLLPIAANDGAIRRLHDSRVPVDGSHGGDSGPLYTGRHGHRFHREVGDPDRGTIWDHGGTREARNELASPSSGA